METSYECIFDGKDVDHKCDYGVRICTDYIEIPANFQSYPEDAEMPFGCRWVRKSLLISTLEGLEKQQSK